MHTTSLMVIMLSLLVVTVDAFWVTDLLGKLMKDFINPKVQQKDGLSANVTEIPKQQDKLVVPPFEPVDWYFLLLQRQIDKLKRIVDILGKDVTNLKEKQKGDTYIRWGRTTCGRGAQLVYQGFAAGPKYDRPGSGSNYLCLHSHPQWNNVIDGNQMSGEIYGVEYEFYNSGIHRNNVFLERNGPIENSPVPCAVCYVEGTVLMIPGRTECPRRRWKKRYAGYLAAEYTDHTGRWRSHQRSSYICMDEAPESALGGENQKDQSLVYPVEVTCGSLPCDKFTNGSEVTCVVCSK